PRADRRSRREGAVIAETKSLSLPETEPAAPRPGSPLAVISPLRRQYLQIKRRFPDTILLFRLGDFYETFERDAEIAASVLDIVAVVCDGPRCGIAYADLSTGEFAATQLAAKSPAEARDAAGRELLRLGAAEVVVPGSPEAGDAAPDWLPDGPAISRTEPWR